MHTIFLSKPFRIRANSFKTKANFENFEKMCIINRKLPMVSCTKALPRIHVNISGTLRPQFVMTKDSERDFWSLSAKKSLVDLFSMKPV